MLWTFGAFSTYVIFSVISYKGENWPSQSSDPKCLHKKAKFASSDFLVLLDSFFPPKCSHESGYVSSATFQHWFHYSFIYSFFNYQLPFITISQVSKYLLSSMIVLLSNNCQVSSFYSEVNIERNQNSEPYWKLRIAIPTFFCPKIYSTSILEYTI